jgi:predicted Na+-dependent transporter
MVVAAGNDNDNACLYSPASASSAVTVGATDTSDSRASYSNYGSCLDLFAPGSSITSAWIGFPSAQMVLSGTSMAAPHVAGIAAVLMSTHNNTLNASEVTRFLLEQATENVLSNVNGSVIDIADDNTFDVNNSPNLLAYTPACGNSTTSGDGSGGIFSTTKTAFRFLSVVFLVLYSLEIGLLVDTSSGSLKRHLCSVGGSLPPILNQVLILPFLVLVLVSIQHNLDAQYDIGLLLMAVSPCGVMSNSLVQLTKGNSHLSLSLSFFANTLSLLIIPPLMAVWIHQIYPAQNHGVHCSISRLFVVMASISVASLFGIVLRKAVFKMVTKCLSWLVSAASAVVFSISLGLVVIAYGPQVQDTPTSVWLVCLILQIAGISIAYTFTKCFSKALHPIDRMTVAFESGSKNFMVTLAMIAFAYHDDHKNELMTVPLIYGEFILWLHVEIYVTTSCRYY